LTNVPSLPLSSNITRDNVYLMSGALVERGDHIRLQDIRLSFNISKAQKLMFIQDAQVYLYANNLGILWRANRHNIDPDFGDLNIPTPKSVAIGLNIIF
jgi:hypothetical protein